MCSSIRRFLEEVFEWSAPHSCFGGKYFINFVRVELDERVVDLPQWRNRHDLIRRSFMEVERCTSCRLYMLRRVGLSEYEVVAVVGKGEESARGQRYLNKMLREGRVGRIKDSKRLP